MRKAFTTMSRRPENFDERTAEGVLNTLAVAKREHGDHALDDIDLENWDPRRAWFEAMPLQEAQDYVAAIWTAKKPRIHKGFKADYLHYLLWQSPRLDQLFADTRLDGLRKAAGL